jgi:DNA replication protein DnaC
MSQQTIDKLSELRLTGFIEALSEQAQSTNYLGLSFEERLSFLVDREFLRRQERRLAQSLKDAQLKQRCSIEDIDFESPRGLNRSQLMELAHCDWIRKHHNLIITGPTGAGKSFLACALADRACKLQFRALYIKCSDLLRELLLAKAGATYHKIASRIARMDLLIIDEWLRDPLAQDHARELLDLLDDRFRQASTIFISQLPVPDWHQRIDDPTLADAILDRIVHDSLRLQIKGEDSMRKLTARVNKKEPSLRSD